MGAHTKDTLKGVRERLGLPPGATLGDICAVLNGDKQRPTMQEALDWEYEAQHARRVLRERGLVKAGPAVKAFNRALRED
jgi:hypothetical protein